MAKKTKRARPPDRLVRHLSDQLEFLRRSAEGFDEGFDGEASRMAVTLRVLLHDTKQSHSLLSQMGVLAGTTLFVDTAVPIDPRNLVSNPGLVMMRVVSGGEGTYVPGMGDGPMPARMTAFDAWWTEPITKYGDDGLWSRKDHVLAMANKEGGAHVDPNLNEDYEVLVTDNALGFTYSTEDGGFEDFRGNPVAASVRQIGYEFLETCGRLKLSDGTRLSRLRI